MWYNIDKLVKRRACLGVAQLVARDFWEVEVAGSSPVTQTIFCFQVFVKCVIIYWHLTISYIW